MTGSGSHILLVNVTALAGKVGLRSGGVVQRGSGFFIYISVGRALGRRLRVGFLRLLCYFWWLLCVSRRRSAVTG